MIRLCTELDFDIINNYIGDNYQKCLYLYLNYKKYGLKSEQVKMCIQEDNNVVIALILIYYDCMHIYSKSQNCNYDELYKFIEQNIPTVICAEKQIIKNLELKLNKKYNSEYGWIRQLKDTYLEKDPTVKRANESDFKDIAELLFSDVDIGNIYNIADLYSQIKERNSQGYGRNYIIKQDNTIISHGGTGAENNEVAVINYVITNEKYRCKGYAKKVVTTLCSDLIKENKNIYLVNYTNESTKLYDKLGFVIACDWGKLYLKNERG